MAQTACSSFRRVRSEILALSWSDIDWKRNRILITAGKTAHHVGREEREIPLFPELRLLLLQAKKEKAPDVNGTSLSSNIVSSLALQVAGVPSLVGGSVARWVERVASPPEARNDPDDCPHDAAQSFSG